MIKEFFTKMMNKINPSYNQPLQTDIEVEKIKIKVINLDQNQERLNQIKKRLKEEDMDFERFSAINGKEIKIEDYKELLDSRYKKGFKEKNKKQGIGHLGCLLSHKRAWEEFLKDGSEENKHLLILEDDVIIQENFKEQLAKRIEHIPKDFDIILLGFNADEGLWEGFKSNKGIPKINQTVEIKAFAGLYAYIIKKESIKKILKELFPIKWHMDYSIGWLAKEEKIKVYGLVPPIVHHPGKFRITAWNYKSNTPWEGYESTTNN